MLNSRKCTTFHCRLFDVIIFVEYIHFLYSIVLYYSEYFQLNPTWSCISLTQLKFIRETKKRTTTISLVVVFVWIFRISQERLVKDFAQFWQNNFDFQTQWNCLGKVMLIETKIDICSRISITSSHQDTENSLNLCETLQQPTALQPRIQWIETFMKFIWKR